MDPATDLPVKVEVDDEIIFIGEVAGKPRQAGGSQAVSAPMEGGGARPSCIVANPGAQGGQNWVRSLQEWMLPLPQSSSASMPPSPAGLQCSTGLPSPSDGAPSPVVRPPDMTKIFMDFAKLVANPGYMAQFFGGQQAQEVAPSSATSPPSSIIHHPSSAIDATIQAVVTPGAEEVVKPQKPQKPLDILAECSEKAAKDEGVVFPVSSTPLPVRQPIPEKVEGKRRKKNFRQLWITNKTVPYRGGKVIPWSVLGVEEQTRRLELFRAERAAARELGAMRLEPKKRASQDGVEDQDADEEDGPAPKMRKL